MSQQFSLASLFQQHFGGEMPSLKSDFDKLDGGRYRVSVDSVESRVTNEGQGLRIVYPCTIIEGQSVGRKMWIGFNVQHPTETTVKNALKDLCAFTVACGLDLNSVEVESHVGSTPVIELVYSMAKDKSRVFENYRFVDAQGQLLELNGKYTAPIVIEEPQTASQAQPQVQQQAQQQAQQAPAPWVNA